MASGHVNRTDRPNTWLHRPSLQREESSCQPGAVHTWPFATDANALTLSPVSGRSGHEAILPKATFPLHCGLSRSIDRGEIGHRR